MKSLLLFAIYFLCFSPLCLAQTVWPGDVNNNGIVNEVDLLYLGYAFNKTGPSRTIINSNWTAQDLTTIWEDSFPDGLNLAYADCNGDGIVDEVDADVIEANLAKTHTDGSFIVDEILEPSSDLDAKFFLKSSKSEVALGEMVTINVELDADDVTIPEVLGFAFTIGINPRFIDTTRTKFDIQPITWLSLQGTNTVRFFPNKQAGKITVAMTKTDQEATGGSGEIGSFSFVMIEDIIDLRIEDTIRVEIDSITIVTDDLEKIPGIGASIDLDLIGRPTSTYNPILDKIKFYPNPTNGWLLLKSKEVAIEKVELVNTLGQVIYQKQLTNSTFQSLDLQAIPEGMYWLRMITELGTKSTPIQRL